MVVISSLSVASAQAATAANTPGGTCAKSGAITVIGGKTYTCTKALTGKLVWLASATPSTIGGAKPHISGGLSGEGGEEGVSNPGDDQGSRDNSRRTGLAKYNACLVAHGGTALVSSRRVRSVNPTTGTLVISPTPKLSATQSKAIATCVSLAPKPKLGGDN